MYPYIFSPKAQANTIHPLYQFYPFYKENPFQKKKKSETSLAYLFLIAADIAKKASSTLMDSLALVSRNGMPISSA